MSAFSNLLAGQSSREIGRLLKSVVQKQINEELTDTDIAEAEVHTPVQLSNTKDLSLIGDLGAQASFNVATEIANNHYMTFEPDGVDLRLWLKFQNAGALIDYAKRDIKAYSVGENNLPGTFIHYNDDINVKYEIFSYFNGESHFAFAKDNPAIQLKNIIVDSGNKPFCLHMRMKPITFSQSTGDANITVASKVDDDQLRYGYSVTITPQGHMNFYIRKDYVQYHLFVKDAYSWLFQDPLFISGHSFNKTNFNSLNFQTTYAYLCQIANSPELRFEDWVFSFKPTTNQMTVLFNGDTVLADSTTYPTQKPYMNLALQDGKWRHESSTAWNNICHDSSGNAKNGTLAGSFGWNIDNGLYNLGSDDLGTTGGMELTFPNDATTNTLTQFTATIQYYLWDTAINTKTYDAIILSKGVNVNNSFWVEHITGSDKVRANIRASNGTVVSVVSTNPLLVNAFNFISVRWKSGEGLKLVVNGGTENVSSTNMTTTITNGTTQMKIGSIAKSERSQLALFKFYTVQIAEQTMIDLIYAGWHNPLFPQSESIQPVPDPAPAPIETPLLVIGENTPIVPSSATDYRYINTAGGDNPYFPLYNCPDGVSIVDPIVQRYSVGPGAVIPGSPVVEQIEVPSQDNSYNILQRQTTTNEIAGVQIRAPANRPNPTNSSLMLQNTSVMNKVSTAPSFPAPKTRGMVKGPGPVFADAKIYYIFVGSNWETRSNPSKQDVINAINTTHTSTYYEHMVQYGIRKPKIAGFASNPTFNSFSSSWTIQNAMAAFTDTMNKNIVPKKTRSDQFLYVFIMPHNIPKADGDGGFSTLANYQSAEILDYYPVAFIGGTTPGIAPGSTVFDIKTLIITNEVVEPISNPYGGTNVPEYDAWRADPNILDISNQDRVADVCEHLQDQVARVAGVRISPYYSNHHGSCITPDGSVTYAICPTGSTYSSSTQMCESTGGTTPPPTTTPTTSTNPIIPPFPQPQGATYFGGPVYSEPKIYVIFDGAVWDTLSSPFTKQQIIDKCNAIQNSTFFDALLQYGVKKPKSITYVTMTSNNLPSTYAGVDVRDMVSIAINSGLVPNSQPISNKNIYVVVAGPNKVFGPAPGSNGSHFIDWDGNNLDTQRNHAQACWKTDVNVIPRTIFSELVECMTDAFGTPWQNYWGWRINRSVVSGGDGNELSDPGEPFNNVFLDNVNVRPYWSNVDQKVVPPPNAPAWLTCPTGSTYNKVTQMCESGGAPGGGGTTSEPSYPPHPTIKGYYFMGGEVYSAPNVYFIFEGSAWNTLSTPFSKQQVTDAVTKVMGSTYFDALIQYGVKKPKSFKFVVNTTKALPSTYGVEDVQAVIEDSKSKGLVPTHLPTSQRNIYSVLASPGKTFVSPSSEAGAVAWNGGYWTNDADKQGTITLFNLDSFRANETLSRFTRSLFHELVESMASTPYTGGGWRRVVGGPATNGVGNQICDPGEGFNEQIVGVTVGSYWSNIDNKIVPPPTAPTWLTCPTGSTYDPTTQLCHGAGGGGPGGGPATPTIVANISGNEFASVFHPDFVKKTGNKIISSSSGIGQAMVGKAITKMSFYMHGRSTPTGQVKAMHWDSNGNVKVSFGSVDSATLFQTSSGDDDEHRYDKVDFTDIANRVPVAVGDIFGVEWVSASGSLNDQIRVQTMYPSSSGDSSIDGASVPSDANSWVTGTDEPGSDPFQVACIVEAIDPNATGPGTGGNAALDKDGVFSLYGTGEINYTPEEDYKDESYRLDWEINSSSKFISNELTVYVRMEDPPTDECAGILGGGKHSSGSSPKCYVIGVGTKNGAVRLRLEEDHPDYEEIGQGTATGQGLSGNRWLGYKYVKWNKPDGVLIEIWQDAGNNDTTPSNEWVKLGGWLETRENWRNPPSDHMAIFRIDGSNDELETFEYKWASLREIKSTDTGNTPPDGGGPVEPLPDPPLVGIGADLLDRVVKTAVFWLRGASTPTGTGYCRIWDENNQPLVTLGSFSASGLSTSSFSRREFTNNNNTIKMKRGYTIGIEYNTGTTGDIVQLQRNNTSFDSSIVQASKKYQGPWGIYEGFEIRCIFIYTYMSPDIEEWHVLGSTPVDVGMLGEVFGAESPMIGIPPTHFECSVYRFAGISNGTVNLDHISATGELKGRLKTVPAVNLPTSEPTGNNFIWENFNYLGKIVAGDRLCITVDGVGSDAIYVMTNSGGAITNEYDGTRSHLIYKDNATGWLAITNLDLTGKIASGGNSFEAFERFSPSKTHIGEKIVNRTSTLFGRRITKKTIRAKRIGTPTGLMTCGIMDTNYVVKAILGTKDVTTIGTTAYFDVTFQNPGVTHLTEEGDRLFVLFEGATTENTIELNMGRDFVDELNSIAFYIDGNSTYDVGNKDVAGSVFIGGELDVNSRSRIVQSIEHQNSVFKGRKLSRVILHLYRTTVNTVGTAYVNLRRGIDDEIMTQLGSVDVSTLSTDPANPTIRMFTNISNTYVLDVMDKISFEFEGGNTTDRIGVMVKDVAATRTTAVYSHIKKFNGVNYSDSEPDYAFVGKFIVGGYTYIPEANVMPDPTPVADKDLVFCAGRNKISGFFETIVAEARIYSKDITPTMARNLYNNKYTILPLGVNEVLIPFTFKPSGMT